MTDHKFKIQLKIGHWLNLWNKTICKLPQTASQSS